MKENMTTGIELARNYLQAVEKESSETGIIPAGMMPKTREQSVMLLARLPDRYFTALCPRNFDDTLASVTPTLASFKKFTDEAALKSMFYLIVKDVLDFFSVGKTIGAMQLLETIQLIIDDFYYLNIDDFKLCFNNAKRGVYGKIYDRIDGNVIYGWIAQYAQERACFCESIDDRNKTSDTSERISTKIKNEDLAIRISEIQNKFIKKS